jgi:hypothetical protein
MTLVKISVRAPPLRTQEPAMLPRAAASHAAMRTEAVLNLPAKVQRWLAIVPVPSLPHRYSRHTCGRRGHSLGRLNVKSYGM